MQKIKQDYLPESVSSFTLVFTPGDDLTENDGISSPSLQAWTGVIFHDSETG